MLVVLASGGCAPAAIQLQDVRRIEIDRGAAPQIVVEGERLRTLIDTATCRTSAVLWKGGRPATLVMDDGSRVAVDGFSFYGGFLRIHRGQWCELTDEVWAGLELSR